MNSIVIKLYFCTLFFSLSLISACGGGGGSDDEGVPSRSGSISIVEPPSSLRVNEGDVVTISLGATGDGAELLMYSWEVSQGNDDLMFTGGDTDTIRFVAPQVDRDTPVSVDVLISSEDVRLFGQSSFSSNVIVTDLDVVPEHEVGMTTDLPEVDAIDFSNVTSSSTWLVRGFSQETFDLEGIETIGSTVTREIFHVENVLFGNVLEASFCGSEERFTLDASLVGQNSDCDSDDQDLRFYQNDEDFRAEFSCNGAVVNAVDFIFISDSPRTDFGQLEMTFDTYADLEPTSVCGATILNNLAQENIELNVSSIRLVSEYQNQELELFIILDDADFSGIYNFDEFFNTPARNFVTVTSDALPTISGITNSTAGRLFLTGRSPTDITGDLDIQTTDVNLAEENIEAEFTLDFFDMDQ